MFIYFNLFKQISSQSLIILINQLSMIVAITIIASRVDLFTFGQISIAFTLIQVSWIISDWGMTNYVIEKWSDTRNKIFLCCNLIYSRVFISLLMFLLLSSIIIFNLIELPNNFKFWIFFSVFMGSLTPLWFFQLHKVSQKMRFKKITPIILERLKIPKSHDKNERQKPETRVAVKRRLPSFCKHQICAGNYRDQ